jgi:hypothetical protein
LTSRLLLNINEIRSGFIGLKKMGGFMTISQHYRATFLLFIPFILLSLALLGQLECRTNASYVTTCPPDRVSPPETSPESGWPLYANETNPFAQPIPENVMLADDGSGPMVALLQRTVQEKGWWIGYKEWTIPVYLADASMPRYDVMLLAPWAGYDKLLGVPLPPAAAPDPMTDGHIAIIDIERGLEFDFWQFCAGLDHQRPSASWGNVLPLSASGIFPGGCSARASGFALGNGLVWPHEIEQGEIPHALVFAYPYTRAGGPVRPATASDGSSVELGALPEGAQVRLDPNLDLESLTLEPWQKVIARALQRYGMFLGDTGGTLGLSAVNSQSYPEGDTRYAGVLPDPVGAMPAALAAHFQVIAFGEQYQNPCQVDEQYFQ